MFTNKLCLNFDMFCFFIENLECSICLGGNLSEIWLVPCKLLLVLWHCQHTTDGIYILARPETSRATRKLFYSNISCSVFCLVVYKFPPPPKTPKIDKISPKNSSFCLQFLYFAYQPTQPKQRWSCAQQYKWTSKTFIRYFFSLSRKLNISRSTFYVDPRCWRGLVFSAAVRHKSCY